MQAIEDLKKAVEQLEAVAEIARRFAYEGYSTGRVGSIIEPPSTKHGMVEGGVSVRSQKAHRALSKLGKETARAARDVSAIAGKCHREIFDLAPGEPIDEDWLKYVEEWEARRRGVDKGR